MKIIITGALGHIGSQLIRELPQKFSGAEIIMIDNLSSQRYCSLFNLPENGNYSFIEADVINNDLEKIFKNGDVVIHLAALTNAEGSFERRKEVEYVNYNTTVSVANACCVTNCPMIHISSTSVYGTQKKIVDENCNSDELKPQSPYAEVKLKEENFLKSLFNEKKLNVIICRFGTICGISPGMRFHTAVNKFCWQAIMGQPLTVWETALNQKRPYLSSYDAIRAITFIINNRLFDGNIYNILAENLTVNDVIGYIKKYVPDIKIKFVQSEIMNQLSYEVSNQRFIDKGFEFKGKVETNIKDSIELLSKAGGSRVKKNIF